MSSCLLPSCRLFLVEFGTEDQRRRRQKAPEEADVMKVGIGVAEDKDEEVVVVAVAVAAGEIIPLVINAALAALL